MDAVGNERELEADVREGTGEYGGTVEILRGRERLRQIVAQHLIEKETILAENAGLRSLVPGLQDEVSSEQVANIRETEDGVNRALLLAAVEEIAKLKTRVTVLEGEALNIESPPLDLG